MKLFAAAAHRPSVAGIQLQLCGANHHAGAAKASVTMILPSEHNGSPFDFNHMAAGNDKI